MPYSHTVRGERFVFADLRELFARANEPKSGDARAGIAAGPGVASGRTVGEKEDGGNTPGWGNSSN